MSSFAYIDKERTIKIKAINCTIYDQGKRYYCPEPDCTAHMKLRCVESVNAPHFYAMKAFPHTGANCISGGKNQTAIGHDEENFNTDTFFAFLSGSDRTASKIKAPSRQPSKRKHRVHPRCRKATVVRTIGALYQLCKARDVNSVYGGTPIKELLCDDRSNFLYTKTINHKHMIECVYHRYDSKAQNIFLKYPPDDRKPNKYTICIHIESPQLYHVLQGKLYVAKGEKPSPVVIATDWKMRKINRKEVVFGEIVSGRQLYAPAPKEDKISSNTSGGKNK